MKNIISLNQHSKEQRFFLFSLTKRLTNHWFMFLLSTGFSWRHASSEMTGIISIKSLLLRYSIWPFLWTGILREVFILNVQAGFQRFYTYTKAHDHIAHRVSGREHEMLQLLFDSWFNFRSQFFDHARLLFFFCLCRYSRYGSEFLFPGKGLR